LQQNLFQPIVNYRTLEFDKALSARHICQIVNRWADFAGLNQNPDKGDPDRGSGGKLVKGWLGVKRSMNEDNPRCS
jgi:hypothetical protein